MMKARAPLGRASAWMSSWFSPYSSEYSTDMRAAGSFPGLRTGTNGRPRRSASGPPNRKPRDSMPTIAIGWRRSPPRQRSLITCWNAFASASSGVMSRKRIPGCGKVGHVADEAP